jgi:methionyl-tRNA formyltransferase
LGVLVASMLEAGSGLLLELLSAGVDGMPTPVPQAGEATYANKITPEDRHVNWWRPAAEIERVVMIGKAWTTFRGARLVVWQARAGGGGSGSPAAVNPGAISVSSSGEVHVAAGAGAIELEEVQPEGKRRQEAAEWARGARLAPGDAFI